MHLLIEAAHSYCLPARIGRHKVAAVDAVKKKKNRRQCARSPEGTVVPALPSHDGEGKLTQVVVGSGDRAIGHALQLRRLYGLSRHGAIGAYLRTKAPHRRHHQVRRRAFVWSIACITSDRGKQKQSNGIA